MVRCHQSWNELVQNVLMSFRVSSESISDHRYHLDASQYRWDGEETGGSSLTGMFFFLLLPTTYTENTTLVFINSYPIDRVWVVFVSPVRSGFSA